MMNKTKFDVILVGGSYAGLSAALSLGRSLRKVLVIDSGTPCNKQTPYSHNFLTQDGRRPQDISAESRRQVATYETVQFHSGLAVEGKKVIDGFEIYTESGEVFFARKLVFATGIKDMLPPVEGISECWGISVIHCPYCHGYEVRNETTGILANGDAAFELARMVSNLTKQLTIYTNGGSELNSEQLKMLEKQYIRVVEKEAAQLIHNSGYINELVFKDGSSEKLNVLYARVPFKQQCEIPIQLGCEVGKSGHITADMMQKTNVKGVFVCGDSAFPLRSISGAVYTGTMAGAAVNSELVIEEF